MREEKSCAVVGAGLAGLTAAAYLSKQGYSVTVFEASPKPGGRVYSFALPNFPSPIDNGQHLLMGCYTETLKFLQFISPTNRLITRDSLEIDFIKRDRSVVPLKASRGPHPLNLLIGLLQYKGINFRAKMHLLSFLSKLMLSGEPLSRENETVDEWLARNGQKEDARHALWDIIAIGTMNAPPEEASARLFESILRQMFFGDAFSSTLIVPGADLSQTFCLPAESFIRGQGGSISYNERITAIRYIGNERPTLLNAHGAAYTFDAIVFALPLYALKKIEGCEKIATLPEKDFNYSAIITFHIRLNENPLKKPFYGIIGSPMQWVFNHGEHVTTVTSAANDLVDRSEADLLLLFCRELEQYFGITPDALITHKMIKERRATFIPTPESTAWREQTQPKFENIALAGDWTDTKLPATIEGAVLSGRTAAERIIRFL